MIVLLDTSTSVCRLSFIDGDNRSDFKWQADKSLARGLLRYLDSKLQENYWVWSDISGLGVFEGPGSFTGIRIGLTVMNTIADANKIPIAGGQGDDWQNIALKKLSSGKDEKIVLPHYGGEANITTPRK